jgi:hypothetical protein
MTVTIQNLIPAKQAENTGTTQYTSSGKTIIDKFTATNTSAGAATLTVYLVSSGGTAGASNTVLSSRSISAGATYTCPEIVGQVLENAGFIATLADTAAAITIRASGRIIT